MKKDIDIEELLLLKSRRDREKRHKQLFQDFLTLKHPEIYCIWAEQDWKQIIGCQPTILIYADARFLCSVEQIVKLFADNPTQKFVIDHISELKEEQFVVAQLFYHILDRQEYEYNGITIDFSKYTIFMIQHDVEQEYDDFFEYGRKKMVRME